MLGFQLAHADVAPPCATGWRAIREQGGVTRRSHAAHHSREVCAEADGTIIGMDALSGRVARGDLAGRAVKDDPVQARVPETMLPGDRRRQLCSIFHTDDE